MWCHATLSFDLCFFLLYFIDAVDCSIDVSRSLVKSTLSAMMHGSNRARQLFPLLLQLPNLNSDHSEDFKEKVAFCCGSCNLPF